MAEPPGPKPYGARWRRVADLPPQAEGWGFPAYREFVGEWREARRGREGSYIRNLERADNGDLRPFIRYLGILSSMSTTGAVELARDIVRGRTHLRHGNGALTSNGKYYPPPDPAGPVDPGRSTRIFRSDGGDSLY